MGNRTFFQASFIIILLTGLFLFACSPSASPATPAPVATSSAVAASTVPDWFKVPLTDVQTNQTFTIDDFSGKVVLIETIAEWCPTCLIQQNETSKLQHLLGNRPDVVSISLDVDSNEDAASLQAYAKEYKFDSRFAIAPLQVERALGNLYSAEYLNPPLAPMLLIDRKGKVYSLPYGVKNAGSLQKTIEPFLAQ